MMLMMIAVLSAAARLVLFLALTFAFLPIYVAALTLGKGYRRIGRVYWRLVARWSLKASIVVRGQPSTLRPLLMVSNHVSYVDIVVLGSILEGCFVAKSEVRSWPGIGFLARLARTVFVDRRPTSTGRESNVIAQRLAEGEPLILFPEGTSSDGNHVLPFKSALFTVAQGEINGSPVAVQPLSITYTRAGGLPMGINARPFYAWYGDMELAPHLWELMCRGPFQVEVDFHAPTSLIDHGDRKTLARACESIIRQGHSLAITGRCDSPVNTELSL